MDMTNHTGPEPCWTCCGDGYLTSLTGPGTYSTRDDCWMPTEETYPCPDCHGTGNDHGDQQPPDDHDDYDDPPPTWQPHIPEDAHLDDREIEADLPF